MRRAKHCAGIAYGDGRASHRNDNADAVGNSDIDAYGNSHGNTDASADCNGDP